MWRRLHDHEMSDGVGWHAAFLVINTGIILVSLSFGFGLIGGPELLRISVAFYALFVLPGVALSGLVFRAPIAPLRRLCSVFALGVSFLSAVVCVGFIPRVSYSVISVVGAVLTVALLSIERARRMQGDPHHAYSCGMVGETNFEGARGARFILVCVALFALCFFVFYGSGELGPRTDALDHVSYVRRSVESGTLFPHDSFYRDGDGASFDVRKGLWHPVLSLWTYQSHAAADRVWRMIPSFTVFFTLSSFLLFALELCGSTLCAVVSLAFFFLFYGGDGVVWLTKLGYSRNISHVLLWIALAFLLIYYRSKERENLFAAVSAACIGAAYHVAFTLLLGTSLCALFIYVTFLREGREWRSAFWRSAAALAAALAVPLAVRARTILASYNEIHTHQQGMLVFSSHLAIVDPSELASGAGIVFFFALLMAPFFFLVTRGARKRSLVFLLFCVPVLLVLDPVTGSLMERRMGYLQYRILGAAPLPVMLALVVTGLSAVLVFGRPRGEIGAPVQAGRVSGRAVACRIAAAFALGIFVLYPFRTSLRELAGVVHTMTSKVERMPSRYAQLVRALDDRIPDRSVIVSDPITSYVISAYTNHFVVVTLDQHGSPSDTRAFERLREVRNILNPAVPLAASRAWLRGEHADYVLLDMDFPEKPDFFVTAPSGSAGLTAEKFLACPGLLSDMLDLGAFRLFQVHRESLDLPLDHACTVSRAGPLSCDDQLTSDGTPGGESSAARGGTDGSNTGARGGTSGGRFIVYSGVDVGCGLLLARCAMDAYSFHPGDTLRGRFCWKVSRPQLFGLPLDVVIRIDSKYPKGAWYREWYSKQYRRIIERRNSRLYRFTWQEPLLSGFTYPDQWEPGQVVRQDFSLYLPAWMAPGAYEVHVKVIRRSYLMNRSPSDYLSNNDSLEGTVVAGITIKESLARSARDRSFAAAR